MDSSTHFKQRYLQEVEAVCILREECDRLMEQLEDEQGQRQLLEQEIEELKSQMQP